MTSAFFYGTLMHPKILKRVLDNDASHLTICPLGRELTSEESNVRGTLVSGLTTTDLALLDYFEGSQYVRLQVLVHPLGPFTPVPGDATNSGAVEDSLIPTELPPLPAASELTQTVPAQTYVWGRNDRDLKQELWSFDEFVRKNAWKWI